MCVRPQAALQVGLAQTVTSVVTAIMVPCVTLSVETVPVVWAGLAHAVTQVTTLTLLCFISKCYSPELFAPACAHYHIHDRSTTAWTPDIDKCKVARWLLTVSFCAVCLSQNVPQADLVQTASWNAAVKIMAHVTEWQGRVSVARATTDMFVNTVSKHYPF